MKIHKITYSIKPNKKKIKMFNPGFVDKYKYQCKIIFNNKLYPLQSEFEINDMKIENLKIKLICFVFIHDFIIYKEDISECEHYITKKYKRKNRKYVQILKCRLYNMPKMVYTLKKENKNAKEEEKKIKIFGDDFVKNNKDKCIILYKNEIFPLQKYFLFKDIEKRDQKLEIHLIEFIFITNRSYMFDGCKSLEEFELFKGNEKVDVEEKELDSEDFYSNIDNICTDKSNPLYIFENYSSIPFATDKNKINSVVEILDDLPSFLEKMSFMFNDCKSLISLKGLSEWDIINVTDLTKIFKGCSSLQYLPDISRWNTKNIITFEDMFMDCSSLISLPDISKWNTENAEDMGGMFNGCSSLISLPDISKWNTENVENISSLFRDCLLLQSLPDISKWNTKNVGRMSLFFHGCSSLKSLPDISKWNTENAEDMDYMFNGCSSLISIPDISKWNTENIKDFHGLFENCSSLISIPDISKWNTENIEDISLMFCGCSSLISLPDISKWKTDNLKKIHSLFNGCSSLITVPDISKWNTKNLESLDDVFENCSSLIYLPDISKMNTENVESMRSTFKGCSSLISLPDISEWNTKKLKYMESMFDDCSSLISLPDISNWHNIHNCSFNNCLSLIYIPDIYKELNQLIFNMRKGNQDKKMISGEYEKSQNKESKSYCCLF